MAGTPLQPTSSILLLQYGKVLPVVFTGEKGWLVFRDSVFHWGPVRSALSPV